MPRLPDTPEEICLQDLITVLSRLSPDRSEEELAAVLKSSRGCEGDEIQASWPRCIAEAGPLLGYHTQVLECSPSDALHLLESVDCLVCRIREGGSGIRLVLVERDGTGFRINGSERIREGTLTEWMRSGANNSSVLTCVSAISVHPGEHLHDSGHSPAGMLWNLLKPEWNDLNIVLLFAFVLGLLSLATPIAVESLVDTVAFGRFLQPVVVLSLILFAFLGFRSLILGMQTYVMEILQRRLFARLAGEIALRLPRVSLQHLGNQSLPEAMNRFLEVATIQKVTASLVIQGTSIVLTTLIGMTVLAFYHPWLLGFDLLLLLIMAVIVLFLGRGAVHTSIKESKAKYATLAWFEEVSRCMYAFRDYAGSKYCIQKANQLASHYLNTRQDHFRILLRQIIFALFTQALASTVLLGLGGWLVIAGQLTLGQLVAAELIVTVIVGSFTKLGKLLEEFYDLLASVDKISSILQMPIERNRGLLLNAKSGDRSLLFSGIKHARMSGGLSLSLELHAGEFIVVDGAPGSGKSTLLNLVYGLDFPDSGYLTYCGDDLRDLHPQSLRSRVSLVRDLEVFSGTLRENLLMGHRATDRQDINALLRRLDLLDVILELPEGMETEISSWGAPLSSTQVKLLMLSRILIRDPDVILLDGFLDSLPTDRIQKVMSELRSRKDRIILAVTCRAEIRSMADRVLSLDQREHSDVILMNTDRTGTDHD